MQLIQVDSLFVQLLQGDLQVKQELPDKYFVGRHEVQIFCPEQFSQILPQELQIPFSK